MLPSLQSLIRHMAWADASVWTAVLASDEARADPRMRQLLHHIHEVQWVYLKVWRDESLERTEEAAFRDLPSICAWGQAYHGEMAAFSDALASVSLDRPMEFPWAKKVAARWGEVGPVTLSESILQVTAHSTYHRGQVNARLRELGGEPPLVDYVAWLWRHEPAPDWPSEGTA